MNEREQSAYQWACTRAHIVADLLERISIKEDAVE